MTPPDITGLRRHAQRVQPFLPWLSLATGILSAMTMDRSPRRAWWVACATLLGWGALLAFLVATRLEATQLTPKQAAALRAWRHLSRMSTQSAMQLSLFFALPFYARAYGGLWGQGVFIGVLLVGAAMTLWDPLYVAVIGQPVAGAALHALATFAGLNVVLPILGLSNGEGLAAAALGTGLALPVIVTLSSAPARRVHRLLLAAAVSLTVPVLLMSGVVRAVVPAAPLRLGHAAMGTTMEGMTLVDPTHAFVTVPSHLVCATTIVAPRGLRDALFHVWSRNGVELDRIALRIRGNDEAGFRTWSVKQHLGATAHGTWRCAVVTESGQSLGQVTAVVP